MSSRRGRGRSDRDLHRFRPGSRCLDCPARRWYSESGFRYCENGHRIEGFIEFAAEDEDNFGQTGHVARKERTVREKPARHLAGNDARELFLECLQLVLRRQIRWLVDDRGLPPELETVVRDLWDLRVRNFGGLKTVDADGDDTDGGGGQSGTDYQSGAESEYFSSQPESDADARPGSVASGRSSASRARSWTSEAGQHWDLPALADTLALCYLGCLALRLPVRLGTFYNWARDDRILFLGAAGALPREMLARLPGAYHRALVARHAPFKGGELHLSVLGLVVSYHSNYEMAFPALNTPLLLLQYLRELALPVDVYAFVRQMSAVLGLNFSFDMQHRRFSLLQHPDILLVACVVLATKILYPFDGVERVPEDHRDPACLKMDWGQWRAEFREPASDALQRRDMDKLSSDDAWVVSTENMDRYLDWYQDSNLTHREDDRDMMRLFPLADRSDAARGGGLTDDEIDERLMRVQGYLRGAKPMPASEAPSTVPRAGARHQQYRKVEDMPETAKAFHERAAELAGLSLAKLLKAVSRLETLVEKWSREDARQSRSAPRAQAEVAAGDGRYEGIA